MHLFLHFKFLEIFTLRKDIVSELNTKIFLFKSFFKPKIVFKTSLACNAPIIPATGAKIPCDSQLFSSRGCSGIKHLKQGPLFLKLYLNS